MDGPFAPSNKNFPLEYHQAPCGEFRKTDPWTNETWVITQEQFEGVIRTLKYHSRPTNQWAIGERLMQGYYK